MKNLILFIVVLIFITSNLFAVEKFIKITNYNNYIEIEKLNERNIREIYLIPKMRIINIKKTTSQGYYYLYIFWTADYAEKSISLSVSDSKEHDKYYEQIRKYLTNSKQN